MKMKPQGYSGSRYTKVSCCLLVLLLYCLPTPGDAQDGGFVSFAQDRVVADEGSSMFTPVAIPLLRVGGTSGAVVVSISFPDPNGDLFSVSIVTTFPDGSSQATATAVIRNDNIPEGNETFTLTITGVSGAQLGARTSMQLIIRANDEPHGCFQFNADSLSSQVSEPQNPGGPVFSLTVLRGPGTFGRVTVDYEIIASDPSIGLSDISPSRGTLLFADGVSAENISLTVTPDSVPEPDELVFVRLMNPTGGAALAAQDIQAAVTIQANDAPISWSQALTTVREESGLIQLTLTRGLLADGSMAGDLAMESTVQVTSNSASASSGSDFSPISQTVTFAPGISSISLPVTIIDDTSPEGDEMFTLVLSSPSAGAVLSSPSTATVLIRINDNAGGLAFFASPGPVIAREDEQTVGTFIVRRTVGTFGNLTAEWRISSNQDGSLATSDFSPAQGTVTILDGETDANLEIVAFNDDIPEVSEGFTVELVRVISEFGGLSDMSPRLASLIVAESDDVYGLLQWGQDSLLSVVGSAPRELMLSVNRTGGTMGTIAVDYSIVYLPPSGTGASTALTFAGFVQFQGGMSTRDFSVTLPDNAFLEIGGNFMATIDNATLVSGATFLIPPVSSPQVGSRSQVLIPVPIEATSGFISFDTQSFQVSVSEPESAISTVALTVTRTGSFGTATITWTISPISSSVGATVQDTGGTAGQVVIPNGGNSNTFLFTAVADDVPEVDELFLVTLIAVNEPNQMILPQQNEAVVTILANDDPSGVFSISNSTRGPFFLNEENNRILVITIARNRGDLTRELISYDLIGRPTEIAGGQGIADFPPGQREVDVTLFVTNDNIPEINDTFLFRITPVDVAVELEEPTTVDITVLANDDYAGVFSFNDSSLTMSIVEPVSNATVGDDSRALLTVIRDAGAFGVVEVYWEVTNPSTDISATSGVLVFAEGERTAVLEIVALPDDNPEAAETYRVELLGASGDARLGSAFTSASITILQNDDPIRFSSGFAEISEGDTATLTLIRGGQANGVAQVVYTVTYSEASPADLAVSPANGMVEFAPGQMQASVMVTIVDDDEPEQQEMATVSLISVSGDAVLVSPDQATLVILFNDDPSGIFSFRDDSLLLEAQEGDTAQLMVMRNGGAFGSVSLRWTVYFFSLESGSRSPASISDLSPITGVLSFAPGEVVSEISLTVHDDSLPELEEAFEVELMLASVDGGSVVGARLDNGSTAVVVVGASDEPHGVIGLSDASTSIALAEDIPPESPGSGQAQLLVDRAFGTIGTVRTLWEVFPLSDDTFPDYVDLLFFGDQGAGVSMAMPRPHTTTTALQFSGQPGGVVTVPRQYQPTNISAGFTISVWLQPSTTTNGILLAKTSASGLVYALSLVSDGANFLLRLTYQQNANGQTLGTATAEVSLLQAGLTDGAWHSLIVAIGEGVANFYRDGNFVSSRTLLSSELGDETGELTVGGQTTSNFYAGALQDVRVYVGVLQLSQVQLVSSDSAATSLTPISGYISFSTDANQASVSVSSVDDSVPEPRAMFLLSLTNAAGGARVDASRDTSIITVLKSDSSNGVFGFTLGSLAGTIGEPGSITLTINRTEGMFGDVTVSWEVRETSSGMVATQDFNPATGTVEFQENDSLQIFIVASTDEMIPELNEDFVVVLTSAVANDNQSSSTPTSGASIDSGRSQAVLVVTENDFPYGVLQFSASAPVPEQPIPVATTMPELIVDEASGAVTVYVVRAQGVVGNINIEFFTSDGTATDLGVNPDYDSNAGQLSFPPGTTVQSFNVTLVDDSDPELAKTFFVNLTNPQSDSGLPGLGVGQTMAITIQPSDDAFGRFSFSSDSLSRVVPEQLGSVALNFTILRAGGTFGLVSISWLVTQTGDSALVTDISPATGVVMFPEGDTMQQFTLYVADDLVAELMEVFTVELVNVTVGASITSVSAATITIQASDHPYGRFVFSPALRPLRGVAESGRVEVVVTREFGDIGQVRVDVQTVSSEDPTLSTLLDIQELMNNSQIATVAEDYDAITETLTFENGETSKSFYINITADSIPEIDEYLFAVITGVELNQASVATVDTTVLPSVVPGNDSLAILVISENDDARGVIGFTESIITTAEPSQEFISVQRSEGTFGEITVQWEAVPATADVADYSPQSGVVVIPEGIRVVPLPLAILDDSEPEFLEVFEVQLLSVSNGRLGVRRTSTITIAASDDPNGAFEFSSGSRQLTVEEPEDREPPAVITLTVQRVGGAVGVVSVAWRVISRNGDEVSADVLPVANSLQFVTNATEQSFVLTILPDDIPELDEVFSVELVSATGGGNIGMFPAATITVAANDGPYGVVAFSAATFATSEIGDNETSLALLTITRSIGNFGDIQVLFNVQSADAATLALADGTPLLSYFDPPIPDLALVPAVLLQRFSGSMVTLTSCGRSCLSDRTCMAFSIDLLNNMCELYLANITPENSVVSLGTDYYQKLQDRVLPFYRSVASNGNDFTAAVGQGVVIPDGERQASIPITIIGDLVPELNESLLVTLTSVELVNPQEEGGPLLGQLTEATLVILENDDPQGVFTVSGSDGSMVVQVVEPDSLSTGVTLTVERLQGSIGQVSVSWSVTGGTALQGLDFIGTGATLVFDDGDTRSTIALLVLADDMPEIDETLIVSLSGATGGASIATGEEGSAMVVINANDGVAGVVGLSSLFRSAVVGEGETAVFEVVRGQSAMGLVEVDWEISGTDAALEFVNTQGTERFLEGVNTTFITTQVRADAMPELAERYTLTLLQVRTISDFISSESGAAALDPQASTATITIRASNNPHGEVAFQASSLVISTQEDSTPQLTIIRQFGTFGAINVTYRSEAGSVTGLSAGASLATPGMDFSSEGENIVLGDGQESATIDVTIVNDDDPELDEVFVVRLVSVTLLDMATGTVPPTVGVASVAEVTIQSNDSPGGTLTFIQEFYTVQEDVGSVDIVVAREQGTFGQVSVVYFVSNVEAMNGQDYVIEPVDALVFVPGQPNTTLSITITDDSIPEIEEGFCVGLRLPRDGAVLGNITMTCVTILPNDDAYGVFSFSVDFLSTALQETQGTATADNVATLRVIRTGGLFDQVTVPFEVIPSGPEGATPSDLSLSRGAVLFNQGDDFRNIQVEAVMDDTPELAEVFSVILLEPTGLGRLSTNNTVATIEILPNQDPQGVLQIAPVSLQLGEGLMAVEENIQFINYEVTRSFGTFGDITVAVETSSGTATSPNGPSLSAATSQVFPTTAAAVWLPYISSRGSDLLALGSSSQATLYGWRGVFSPVQSVPANGVTGFTAFSPAAGDDFLVVANGGTPGNREIDSQVYMITEEEELVMVQRLPTVGAADVLSFQSPSSLQWYVVVANGEDDTGNTNVDSVVYQWNGTTLEAVQAQLPTRGASALETYTLDGQLYLAVASVTDTRSQVFIWIAGQFRLDHTFDTQQATDITFLSVGPYLVVASETAGLSILTRAGNGDFATNVTMPLQSPVRVERGSDVVIVVTNSRGPAQVFQFSEDRVALDEVFTVSLPIATYVRPFITTFNQLFLAAAGVLVNSTELSILYNLSLVDEGNTDFSSKNLTLMFRPGEASLFFTVAVYNDDVPEVDEDFNIALSMPSGGARLGQQSSITTTILTNDDAHGVIGFNTDSVSRIVMEMDGEIVLNVDRRGGTFGVVRVQWQLSGDHSTGEISPVAGQVTFPNGTSTATITLSIVADDTPELNEVTMVTLTSVVENGVPPSEDQTRGANLALAQSVAVITVQANDDPHGVVTWSPLVVQTEEEEERNNVLLLTIAREFGATGAIIISYTTEIALSQPVVARAEPLQDFVPASSDVVMGDGASSANVNITILQDNIPEPNEVFLVSITRVRLANEADRQGSNTDSPRVQESGRSLQVVIAENDNNRGLLGFTMETVSVVEGPIITLLVVRTRGTFGSVSVEYAIVDGGTNSGDYRPVSAALVVFASGQETASINILVTDDSLPEDDETFQVVLRNEMGGAEIGTPSFVTVTILSNDDVNGVFSFGDSSLLVVLSESGDVAESASLTVDRRTSFMGAVTVFWEVAAEGTQDLEPTRGNLTFEENIQQQAFTITAVQDGLPEPFEAFPVRLVSVVGGGRLVDPVESIIAIQASDDPAGVLALQQVPGGVVVNEGEVLVVGVTRAAGTSGTVTLTWDITPPDATVFATITDTILLAEGQTQASITVQTLSDNIPEVRRSFTLQIVSVTQARVNINATEVEVIIPASNNPYGTVELSSEPITAAEGSGTVRVPVIRTGGLIGALQVNFTAILDSANSTDFRIGDLFVVVPPEMSSALVMVDIIDDDIPELAETFFISLTSVEVLGDADNTTLPPTLGTNTRVEITIPASDDPFGSISISEDSFTINEGDTLRVPLVRVGGMLGVVTVSYATAGGRAVAPDDYTETAGNIVFASQQARAEIFVPIVDDQLPEIVENFVFSLLSVTGGSLGNITRATILIAASDSPFGVVGFASEMVSAGVRIPNPIISPVSVTLTVSRMGGTMGSSDIRWAVVGPGDSGTPSADIATSSGVLSLTDGQSSGIIIITVLPLPTMATAEREETFTVSLISTNNDVIIDSTLNRVAITVEQNGSPLGVVSFLGDALSTQRVTEGAVSTTFTLPLERDGDNSAPVDVNYIVSRISGDGGPVSLDVTPASGTATFPVLQGRTAIVLTILADQVAELDETYSVRLLSASSGATINPQANTANFIISSNDGNVYGEFGVINASVSAVSSGGIITRSLSYVIVRSGGGTTASSVVLQVLHRYDQDGPELVPVAIERSIPAGSSQLQVILPIPSGAYISPGSVFTVAIANATVRTPAEATGLAAGISPTDGSVQVTAADEVANIAVGFSAQSLIATVDEAAVVGNVELTVFRRGGLGDVVVSWSTGTSTAAGFAPGSLLPASGSLQFPAQQNTTTLTLTASAVSPHGRAELFEVSLMASSLDQSFPSRVDRAFGRALIEPMGVFQIPNMTYSALEGTVVSIPVWRQFGSMGSVLVTGAASPMTSGDLLPQQVPATPNTDFPSTPVSITFQDGVTTGLMNLSLPDNILTSSLKVFQFSLTSVTGTSPPLSAASPRLSLVNSTASITIVDDEGGAGQFQLSPITIAIAEGSSQSFRIVRSGDSRGRVSVFVETVQSGSAIAGLDYEPFNEELIFESGTTQLLMSVTIPQDEIPEGPEDFSISLSAPTSSALINTNADTLRVVIDASDNPNGVFSFLTASLTLREDGPAMGELEVRRTSGLVGRVTLMWEAMYTDGQQHAVPVTDILVSAQGTIIFPDNSATPELQSRIILQLRDNTVPESGEEFSVRLSSSMEGVGFGSPVVAAVTVLPRVIPTFRIAPDNLINVVISSQQPLPIVIERVNGQQTVATLPYSTVQPSEPVSVRGLPPIQPAQPQVDFAQIQTSVTFASGEESAIVNIPILSVGSSPVVFFVVIGSDVPPNVNSTATVIIAPPEFRTSLDNIYLQNVPISTAQALERLSSELLEALSNGQVSGQDPSQYNLTQLTLEQLIQSTLPPTNIDYSGTDYVNNMLDIFQSLLADPSFSGRSLLVQTMKSFAYSLLDNVTCNGPAFIYSRPLYYLRAAKLSHSALSGKRFSSNNDTDFAQFPTQIIAPQLDCMNVHYLEFFTDNLFGQPTLLSKVLSAGIEGVSLTMTSEPIIVRIHSEQNLGVLPDNDHCLLWEYPSTSGAGITLGNQWDDSICSPETALVVQQDYVQCACRQLGEMAVSVDLEIGYGWTFPAGISAASVLIAILLVMILHLVYLSRTQLETRILICLCFSVFLFQLILLVDIFASDMDSLSANSCAALGALLQFTAVAQFLWIAAMAIALWVHFIGWLHGNEPVALYILITWGLAVLVVVATIVIGSFAVDLDLNSSEGVYGRVKDLCFMPLVSVSLISTVLPVLISVLAMVALISYTCVFWSRWEDAKSIYQDSFNRTEIPLLLIFFCLIFLSSLAAYLHVYIGLTYTLGAFIILNTLEGLYALVVYFFVSWHTLTRKHNKYNVGDEVEALGVPGERDDDDPYGNLSSMSLSTFASSKEQLVDKDLQEVSPAHSAESGVVSLGMRRLRSGSGYKTSSPYSPLGEENKDDSHMDDLLFMLKTQNFSPSSAASDDSEHQFQQHNTSGGSEHFERRRISIADTHL